MARGQTARQSRLAGDADNFVAATLTGHFPGESNRWAPANEADNLIAHTLCAEHDAIEDGTGRGTPLVAAQPGNAQFNGVWDKRDGVRRLMPIECERLQGFPDGWTDGQADSPRYRQLGNAVAVPVSEWIGRRIVAVTR